MFLLIRYHPLKRARARGLDVVASGPRGSETPSAAGEETARAAWHAIHSDLFTDLFPNDRMKRAFLCGLKDFADPRGRCSFRCTAATERAAPERRAASRFRHGPSVDRRAT